MDSPYNAKLVNKPHPTFYAINPRPLVYGRLGL